MSNCRSDVCGGQEGVGEEQGWPTETGRLGGCRDDDTGCLDVAGREGVLEVIDGILKGGGVGHIGQDDVGCEYVGCCVNIGICCIDVSETGPGCPYSTDEIARWNDVTGVGCYTRDCERACHGDCGTGR